MKSFLLLLAMLPLFSQACSFGPGYERFVPALNRFQEKMDGDHVATLPVPKVTSIKVQRGTTSAGSSCDDAGRLTLDINWPESSIYKLNEIGFYFRVLSGGQPNRIFPLEPISGKVVGQRARFFFAWLDGHPSSHGPLNLHVEVFAVNNGLQIGPSHRFQVRDEKRSRTALPVEVHVR